MHYQFFFMYDQSMFVHEKTDRTHESFYFESIQNKMKSAIFLRNFNFIEQFFEFFNFIFENQLKNHR